MLSDQYDFHHQLITGSEAISERLYNIDHAIVMAQQKRHLWMETSVSSNVLVQTA